MLRPWGLLVLAIGGFFFVTTLKWWILLLTLATYASLVFLATRGRSPDPGPRPPLPHDLRIRCLPHAETRQRAQAVLEAYGRALVAIEEADESTRAILPATLPKLRRVLDALLDVAEARAMLHPGSPSRAQRRDRHNAEARPTHPEEPEGWLRSADLELSEAPDRLQTFRAEVVRASVEGGEEAASRAANLESSLTDWQRRLDDLRDEIPSPGAR